MHLLLIEDDAQLAAFILRTLREVGHVVAHAADGDTGRSLAESRDHEVLIVDRLLPGGDGLELIAALRQAGRQTPVLIISALSDVDERIRGLRAGGDDYLVKPFAVEELLARIEVLGRRTRGGSGPVTRLQVADLELDLLGRVAMRGGVDLDLKPQEFKLLEYLVRNAGQVLTRAMILEAVWDYHFDPQTNVVDVHVSRLRARIDVADKPALIHTVRGAGYCLRAPDHA